MCRAAGTIATDVREGKTQVVITALDAAVAALKQGAADYLLKDRMARLGLAVQRALQEQELHHRGRSAGGHVVSRRHQRLGIQLPFSALGGDGNWVGDVRLAGLAHLAAVAAAATS